MGQRARVRFLMLYTLSKWPHHKSISDRACLMTVLRIGARLARVYAFSARCSAENTTPNRPQTRARPRKNGTHRPTVYSLLTRRCRCCCCTPVRLCRFTRLFARCCGAAAARDRVECVVQSMKRAASCAARSMCDRACARAQRDHRARVFEHARFCEHVCKLSKPSDRVVVNALRGSRQRQQSAGRRVYIKEFCKLVALYSSERLSQSVAIARRLNTYSHRTASTVREDRHTLALFVSCSRQLFIRYHRLQTTATIRKFVQQSVLKPYFRRVLGV